jgi:hypothetical protein
MAIVLKSYISGDFRRSEFAYHFDRLMVTDTCEHGKKIDVRPGDLPIEQPTTFELVVNMKTAKLLGLAMSPEIWVRATHVIQ